MQEAGWNLEFYKAIFTNYWEYGLFFAIYLGGLVYLVYRRDALMKRVFVTPFLIFLFTIFNPLVVEPLLRTMTDFRDRYSRFFWMLPAEILSAYLLACLIERQRSGREKTAAVLLTVCLLFLCGGSATKMELDDNIYKIDNRVIEVADLIGNMQQNERPVVFYDEELYYWIRQYDPSLIAAVEAGEMQLYRWITKEDIDKEEQYESEGRALSMFVRGVEVEPEIINGAIETRNADFFVRNMDFYSDEYLKELDMEYVNRVDGYEVCIAVCTTEEEKEVAYRCKNFSGSRHVAFISHSAWERMGKARHKSKEPAGDLLPDRTRQPVGDIFCAGKMGDRPGLLVQEFARLWIVCQLVLTAPIVVWGVKRRLLWRQEWLAWKKEWIGQAFAVLLLAGAAFVCGGSNPQDYTVEAALTMYATDALYAYDPTTGKGADEMLPVQQEELGTAAKSPVEAYYAVDSPDMCDESGKIYQDSAPGFSMPFYYGVYHLWAWELFRKNRVKRILFEVVLWFLYAWAFVSDGALMVQVFTNCWNGETLFFAGLLPFRGLGCVKEKSWPHDNVLCGLRWRRGQLLYRHGGFIITLLWAVSAIAEWIKGEWKKDDRSI